MAVEQGTTLLEEARLGANHAKAVMSSMETKGETVMQTLEARHLAKASMLLPSDTSVGEALVNIKKWR